jgi:hypothetical protein
VDGAALTPDEAAAVLRRAAELDAADLERDGGLDTAAVLQLGSELGLREDAVRTALAEHRRLGLTSSDAAPVRLGLDAEVLMVRHVRAGPTAVQAHVGSWLEAQLMQRQRSRAGVTTWRPRRGMAADLRRGLDLMRTLELKGVGSVRVTTQPEGAGTHVAVGVSLTGARSELLGLAVALPAGVVGAVAVVAGVVAGPEALLGLPLAGAAGGAGWLGARAALTSRRRQVAEAVEGLLDDLAAR